MFCFYLPRESGGGNWPGLQRHRPRQLPARPSPPARADPSPGIWRRVPDATSVDAPAKGIISAEMTAGRHAHLRFRAGRTDEGVWPSPVEHSDAGERSISIRHQTVFFRVSSVRWFLAKQVIFVSACQRPNPSVSPCSDYFNITIPTPICQTDLIDNRSFLESWRQLNTICFLTQTTLQKKTKETKAKEARTANSQTFRHCHCCE